MEEEGEKGDGMMLICIYRSVISVFDGNTLTCDILAASNYILLADDACMTIYFTDVS
jgi:hypothetical protein